MNVEDSKRREASNCIRCAKCVNVCPMGLEPYLMATLAKLGRYDDLREAHVMDCIECGCCIFTCPSNRPILDYVRAGKAKVGAQLRAEAAARKAAADAAKAKEAEGK